MKPIQVYITRWTNREIHKFYQDACDLEYWDDPKRLADLTIVVHGTEPIDNWTLEMKKLGTRVLDYRHLTDGSTQGPFAKLVHQRAQIDAPAAYCVMDDDALLKDPAFTMQKVYDKLVLDPNAGATGPYDSFRLMIKYSERGQDPSGYDPQVWSPWTTTGIQCYRTASMKEIQPYWEDLLSNVHSNTDYPIWLLLDYHGYSITEFFDKTFKHLCSNGDTGVKTDAWYLKRLRDCKHNHDHITRVFKSAGMGSDYTDKADTILRNRIMRSIKDGKDHWTKDWEVPLLDHLYNYHSYMTKYGNLK